jgi:enoyl-CoA hydratase/carnithine racemase
VILDYAAEMGWAATSPAAGYHAFAAEEERMAEAAHVSFPATGVGLVLIDNPPMNFGTWRLLEKIEEAVNEVKEAGARVVVLASDVPGYFIAHASLDDIFATRTGGTPSGDGAAWGRVGRELRVGPMISIAANHGQAWGGGAELSYTCNLRIAGESATYGQPEVLLGIIPGGGGTTRLARLIGEARCMEMILEGRPIPARTALEWGLVNRVVPDACLREETIAWASGLASRPAWAVEACKRSLLQGMNLPWRDAARNEAAISAEVQSRPEALDLLRAAAARYRAGADSFEALGLER